MVPADDVVETVFAPLPCFELEEEDVGVDVGVPLTVLPLFVLTELELEVFVLDDLVLLIVPVLLVFDELEVEVFAALELLLVLAFPTGVMPALMTRGLYI